ncbi:hypothetical protein F9C11_33445 [Amycolatopsis sp. VS8301801F10]|uniref:hypothetical protein n=1 Tax=Amycolatopsis sp. VS8301801F10 TaxID=2652442 RepID=UPI0038FC812C
MARVCREALNHFLDLDFFVGTLIDDLDVAGTPVPRHRNGGRAICLERVGSACSLLRYESPKQGTLDFSGSGPEPVPAPPAAEIRSGPGS